MGLSIMATQASAITFIATTGQAYVDGMRFVQFYFGLPIAMVILAATAVPIFHKSGVYTAYEYLERRFDAKTRALASIVFLIQRGMAVGLALYAPAIVMSVISGLAGPRHNAHHRLHLRALHDHRRHPRCHLDGRDADVHHLRRPDSGSHYPGFIHAARSPLFRRCAVSGRFRGEAERRRSEA